MFKHILLPTDGSPVAAKAIKAGVALAKELGAKVTGYYALPPQQQLYYGDSYIMDRRRIAEFERFTQEDGEKFLTIKEIGLEGEIEMFNETVISNRVLDEIPKVCGVTVNTVHGHDKSIEKVFNKFHPNTESMEGAAFMFACEQVGVKYAQIRAVSNLVEKRNKENWNIPLAIENLNKKILEVIVSFE